MRFEIGKVEVMSRGPDDETHLVSDTAERQGNMVRVELPQEGPED